MTSQVQGMSGVAAEGVEIAEPELGLWTGPSLGDPANDWLCVWCHQRIASEKDRLEREGRSEFAFKNPSGMRFQILTFSRTAGCREIGEPTLEHTWFAGYAWSYCVCERCRTHLGWYYTGSERFAGLVRDRIVRAVAVMN